MISIDLNQCSKPLLRAIASESKSKENIKRILEFDEEAVYKTIASNPNAGEEILRYLHEKYGIKVDWSLAENESTPQDVFHDIAKNCSAGLANVLIKNDVLEAQDIDAIVERHQVEQNIVLKAIYHENVSATTLIKIASWHPQFAEEILCTGKVKFTES